MNNLTKKQHYIPQVYLRGFSPEYIPMHKSTMTKSGYTIFQYEIGVEEQVEKAVPIKSICYQDYLYETPNKYGEYTNPNWLERAFSKLEIMFSDYRDRLERKVFYEENCDIKHFLDTEEKSFWITYITLQELRLPEVLEEAYAEARKISNKNISDADVRSFAIRNCIPLFNNLDESFTETTVFNKFCEPMLSMNMVVGVDIEGKLITTDKTVNVFNKKYPIEEYEEVVFPVSSHICLFLLGGESKPRYKNNVLFPIDDAFRNDIYRCMAGAAFKKIYSNHLLDEYERKIIDESRMGVS